MNDPRAPHRLTTAKHLSIYRIRSLADLSTLLTSPATAGGCSSAAGRALLRSHCRRDQELRARCRPQLATKGSPCCQEGHSVLSWTLGPRNTAPGRGALAGRLTRTKHVKGCWWQQMPTTRRGSTLTNPACGPRRRSRSKSPASQPHQRGAAVGGVVAMTSSDKAG